MGLRGGGRDGGGQQKAKENAASLHENPRCMKKADVIGQLTSGATRRIAPCGASAFFVLGRNRGGYSCFDHVAVERAARVGSCRHEIHIMEKPLPAEAFQPIEFAQ